MTSGNSKNLSGKPSRQKIGEFILAANWGAAKDILEFLDKYPDAIDAMNSDTTALMAACAHMDVIVLLLERGANINKKDSAGRTALYHAAYYDQADIVAFLLEKWACYDQKDKFGETALMRAKRNRAYKTVEVLRAWPGIEMRRAEGKRAARELAKELADFSSRLKRPMPVPDRLKAVKNRAGI